MEKIDVFVWVDQEDGAGAAMAARSLRQRMKAEVGDWFLWGSRSERTERLAYDLGMKPLVRPGSLSEAGAAALSHGASPLVLFWSGAAVLTGDWTPVQGGQCRIWEACPAALLRRGDLPAPDVSGWFDLQTASSLPSNALPLNQVKVVGPEDFEKAVHATSWPFGPSVVVLEKPKGRR